MGFYTPPVWGFDNSGQRVAAGLVKKYGASRVRKMASVYYQCKNGHPLGFAWPIYSRGSAQGEVSDHWLEVEPCAWYAFENGYAIDWQSLRHPVPPVSQDFVFFAHRRIDPEFEFYGDPLNPVGTVGWGFAGAIAIESGETSFNVARSVNLEQQKRYLEASGKGVDSAHGVITGARDVIRATTGWRWKVTDLNPPFDCCRESAGNGELQMYGDFPYSGTGRGGHRKVQGATSNSYCTG